MVQSPTVPLSILAALCLVGALGFFPMGEKQEKDRDKILGKHQLPILCLAFSPDGKSLAAAGGVRNRPGEVKLWDPILGTERANLQGHRNRVYALAFSPDGQTLATVSFDNIVKLWDVATGRERASLSFPLPRSLSTVLSPDGQTLALLGLEPHKVLLWRTAAASNGTLAPASSPLAFRADNRGLLFWRLLTGAEGFSPPSPEHDGITSTGAPAKKLTVQTGDVSLGEEAFALCGHEGPVWDVAFSPDGYTLASGSLDKTIKLWDTCRGRLRATLCGHTDQVNGVAFSADGKLLASASHDRTVRLWDGAAYGQQAILTGHAGAVTCVAFAPNGEWLASGSQDTTVRLWSLAGDR